MIFGLTNCSHNAAGDRIEAGLKAFFQTGIFPLDNREIFSQKYLELKIYSTSIFRKARLRLILIS